MEELFFPEEFMIIGAGLKFRTQTLTHEQLKPYIKAFKQKFHIEYSNDDWTYCEYKDNVYTIKEFPKLPSPIAQALMYI